MIQGTWKLVAGTIGGQAVPEEDYSGTILVLDEGMYKYKGELGSFIVNDKAEPHAIDVTGIDGPNAGITIPAIYKLDNDTLTICYDLSATARPESFTSEPDTQHFLAVWNRA